MNSLLSNINDHGDNNEKTKNQKTRVEMFKNMGENIPDGSFLGGNFPGGNFLMPIKLNEVSLKQKPLIFKYSIA